MATERASRPSVSAAHTAEKKFSAIGIAEAGSQRNGQRTMKESGFNTSGCHVQPDVLATVSRLDSEIQWFSVTA